MSLHNDPVIRATLDAHAARMAAMRSRTPEEEDAHWAELRKLSDMRRRALDAYRSRKRAPRPRRHFKDPPKMSRQFVTMATHAARDPRLSKTAVALLVLICALAGTEGYTDARNEALGTQLNRHRSTVKRCLRDLIEFGYLEAELIHTPIGAVKCRRLRPTDLSWPYWHPKRKNPQPSSGFTSAPDLTFPLKGESIEEERVQVQRRKRGRAVRFPCG